MATSDTKQQPAATQLTVPIAWYPAALQPSTTEEQTEDETEDAKLVITEDEIGRFAYFGLGRGINGAEKTPWLNKLNFEVRCVKFQDIVGTEEGGMLKSYANSSHVAPISRTGGHDSVKIENTTTANNTPMMMPINKLLIINMIKRPRRRKSTVRPPLDTQAENTQNSL